MKYNALWQYVVNQNKQELKLTFKEIETVLGFKLEHGFLKYKKELESLNFKVTKISLKESYIIFNKMQ